MQNEIKKNPEYRKGIVEEENEILDRMFMLDDWLYIESLNDRHKEEFLDFFTDEKVFEKLCGLAEKEIKQNDKKANNRLRLMLKDKFDIFQDAQNSFSNKLMPRLTNQYLINWLILLQEYIEKTILLLSDSAKTDVDTKLLAYIFKTFCNYGMNISVKEDVFVNFMKELMGTSLSTTIKYLRSSDMGYKDSVLDTWIKGLELLETLDKENLLVRNCIQKSLIIDDPSSKDIKMTAEQVTYIEKLKKITQPLNLPLKKQILNMQIL